MATNKTQFSRIVTPEGRISYPALFTPKAPQQGGDPKWSASLLIPKTSPEIGAFLAAMQAACNAAIEREWPDAAKRPIKLRMPLKDGDTAESESGANAGRLRKETDPHVAGCWILNTSRSTKRRKDNAAIAPPAVIDRRGVVVTNPAAVYAGAWCRLEISCYPYANVNFGVGAWLESVLFVRDDQPFAQGSDPVAAFGAFIDAGSPVAVASGGSPAVAVASSAPRPIDPAKMFG